MKTRLYIFSVVFILLLTTSGFSQAERDKVEALRVSFISKRIELTTAQSEKFWPMYNEYNDKIKAIKRNLRQSYKRRPETLSEKEAEDLYSLELQSRQAETDIHKQYSEKLKGIIGVKKMILLRVAEEEFKREIINSIKEKGD
jgi:hypothetical protein